MYQTTVSLFTWHAVIVFFSIVADLPIVAKFGHNQLCVYMATISCAFGHNQLCVTTDCG